MFARAGYEGPSVSELLRMAINGKLKRFGSEEPGYADINKFIKNVDINNSEELFRFCEEITSQHNLTIRPREYDQKEWNLLSDDEKNNNWLEKSLYKFINEYFARIYNGAQGNTPEKVKIKLEELARKQDCDLPEYMYENMYHEPIEEELELLKKMKFKGRAILKSDV